ncbi:hypothetical protein HZA55_07505 [Candidatus Poribacteria bacterium]|nr:hypothetical protein [Candidatus Poribacteria bacterium]
MLNTSFERSYNNSNINDSESALIASQLIRNLDNNKINQKEMHPFSNNNSIINYLINSSNNTLGEKYFEDLTKSQILQRPFSSFYHSQENPASLVNKINQIKSHTTLTEEVESYFQENDLLTEIIFKKIEIINEFVKTYHNRFKINIFLSWDIEFHTWEEVVISILIKEKDFEKIFQFWENLLTQIRLKTKQENQNLLIDTVNKKIAIEVKEWEECSIL